MPPLFRSNQGKSDTSQNTLALQWKTLYNHGKVQNPPIAAISACSLYYLAYAVRSHSAHYSRFAGESTGAFYAGAAFLTLGIVPWTLVVMTSTNDRIAAVAEIEAGNETEEKSKGGGLSDEEFDGLLGRWQVLNGIRGVFPLVGGVLGLFLALS